jgi:hypothetical protein
MISVTWWPQDGQVRVDSSCIALHKSNQANPEIKLGYCARKKAGAKFQVLF